MAQQTDRLLLALVEAGFEFVVVGGVAANLHGSAMLTRDFDVLAPLTVENTRRLLAALAPYDPRFYQAAGKPRVERSAEELATFRNLYLSTSLGVLDVLGSLPPLGEYAPIAARAVEVSLFGARCRVLGLEDLITVKAHVARPKDRLVEAELRAILERRGGG